MKKLNQTAYVNTCAEMTGQAYREITMPFSTPFEFARDFEDGEPEHYRAHLGCILRKIHEGTGLNVEVRSLTGEGEKRVTIVVTFW